MNNTATAWKDAIQSDQQANAFFFSICNFGTVRSERVKDGANARAASERENEKGKLRADKTAR